MRTRDHYRSHRYGSQSWATLDQVAPLLKRRGPHLGYLVNQSLRQTSQGPICTVGGARSGKGATVCVPAMFGLGFDGQAVPCLVCDPAGQNLAVSIAAQGPLLRRPVYVFNPTKAHPHVLPAHSVNVLAFLKPDSPTLFSDCVLIAQMCITASGGGDAKFFEDSGRRIVRLVLFWLTRSQGGVSLPSMWAFIRDITTCRTLFEQVLTEISTSQHGTPNVQADILELKELRDNGERTYASVIASLKNEIEILGDASLETALRGGDFELEYLVNPDLCPLGPPLIGCVIPGEFKQIWRMITRVFMGVGMLHARRNTRRHIRPYVLIDEAGALGFAEFVLTAVSEDAKFFQTHLIFQGLGQLERHYGRDGARELMDSFEVLQFISVGDLATARDVSARLGSLTLDVIEPSQAVERKHAMHKALRAMLLYDVPLLETWKAAQHELEQSTTPRLMARELLKPDEVLTLEQNEQLLFVRGGYPPILAEKRPYWMDASIRGYLPDPYHPPADRVQVQTPSGMRWQPIRTMPVPSEWRDWPQYQRGTFWSWA